MHRHSASQEIPRFLRNPKVHCRVHNSPPLVPFHTYPAYFPYIHSNIILLSTHKSSERPLPLRFFYKILYESLISSTAYRQALHPPPPNLVSSGYRGLFPRGKVAGFEAYHSLPSSAEFNNMRSYTYIPPYVFIAWCLLKYRIRLHGAVLN
jgi:hypothetical protein